MVLQLLRSVLPRSGHSVRSISSSASIASAIPEWTAEIGGRAAVERKRILYADKYKQAMEAAAIKRGISVEELKKSAELKTKQERDTRTTELEDRIAKALTAKEGGEKKSIEKKPSKKSQSTPVKPLEDILELSKVAGLSTAAVSQLWTTFHQSKGFLSAAIPTAVYERMLTAAKKYPLFVLPLARDIVGDLPEGIEDGSKGAVEMYFLEWAFLPPPSNISEVVPSPSTVLFTPLAEYKSRASFAQPYLILTHYTDLSKSHGVVLMRGEISDSVALGGTDAQVLSVRLQLFYNPSGEGGERELARFKLLEDFHQRPEKFELDKLVQIAWEL